jgi:hypothetical protein
MGVVRNDWTDELARAYLYVAPHRSLSVTTEYLYEELKREGTLGDLRIEELRSHKVSVGLAYFHPSGLKGSLKGTYVKQDGSFLSTFDTVVRGQDEFVVVDGTVGYRLPNRYGLLTLEVRNLLDREFRFQETDPRRPQYRPGRLVTLNLTVTN